MVATARQCRVGHAQSSGRDSPYVRHSNLVLGCKAHGGQGTTAAFVLRPDLPEHRRMWHGRHADRERGAGHHPVFSSHHGHAGQQCRGRLQHRTLPPGCYFIDLQGVGALGSFTLGFKNGTKTLTLTATQLSALQATGSTGLQVITYGTNNITIFC